MKFYCPKCKKEISTVYFTQWNEHSGEVRLGEKMEWLHYDDDIRFVQISFTCPECGKLIEEISFDSLGCLLPEEEGVERRLRKALVQEKEEV